MPWTEMPLVGNTSCARNWSRSSASCPATAKGSRPGEKGLRPEPVSRPGGVSGLGPGLSPGSGGTGPRRPWHSPGPFISALLWALRGEGATGPSPPPQQQQYPHPPPALLPGLVITPDLLAIYASATYLFNLSPLTLSICKYAPPIHPPLPQMSQPYSPPRVLRLPPWPHLWPHPFPWLPLPISRRGPGHQQHSGWARLQRCPQTMALRRGSPSS